MKTIEAFKREGFYNPESSDTILEGCNRQQLSFLSTVDESKCRVRRIITSMIRKIAVDYEVPKQNQKEYLIRTETRTGQDWTGRKLLAHNIQGVYEIKICLALFVQYLHIFYNWNFVFITNIIY